MTAHRLALYLTSRSLLYFRHVIGHMPVDDVDILVPTALLQEGRDGCPAFGELEDLGYRFSAVEQAVLRTLPRNGRPRLISARIEPDSEASFLFATAASPLPPPPERLRTP